MIIDFLSACPIWLRNVLGYSWVLPLAWLWWHAYIETRDSRRKRERQAAQRAQERGYNYEHFDEWGE